MKRIVRLTASNLKGSSFIHPLAPVTVFWGPNFAGKSSRLEALELALTGSVAGIGVRFGDLHDRLASGAVMEVSAGADGDAVRRVFSRDKKGKCSCVVDGELEAPKVLFDVRDFLDLSAKEQVRFLFRTLSPPDLAAVGPEAITAKLKTFKAEEHTEAHESAIAETCKSVASHYAESDPGETVQEWLERLCDDAAEWCKAATASAKTMRQTVAGSFALSADAPDLGPLEQERQQAHDRLTAAAQAETAALNDFTAAERKVQEAAALARQAVDESEVRALIADQEKIVEQAALVPAVPGWPVAAIMLTPRPSDRSELEAFRAAEAAANKSAQAMVACQSEIQRLEGSISTAKAQTKCPTCQHDITDQQAGVVKRLEAELNQARIKLDNAQAAHEEHRKFEENAAAALELVRKKFTEWEAANARLEADNRAAMDKVQKQHEDHAKAQARINAATAKIAELRARIASNAEAVKAAESLPGLQAASASGAAKYAEARADAARSRAEYEVADRKHREAVAQNSAAQQAAKAGEQASAKEAEAAVLGALRDILAALLAEAVKHSIEPFLDAVAKVTDGILKGRPAYSTGELGLAFEGRGFVNHRSLSGTEKALLHAGVSVALAASSQVKLLVLDELGRLDADNRQKLYLRLVLLVQGGHLDQAVITDTSPPPVACTDGTCSFVELKGGAQ